MKRILTLLLILIPTLSFAFQGESGFTPVMSGNATQANTKISGVDGTAFIDFSTADVLTDYLGGLLVVKDSAGKMIQGYIKNKGTGETLDVETNPDPTFASTTGWTKGAGWSISGGVAIANDSPDGSDLYRTSLSNISNGALVKAQIDIVAGSYAYGTIRIEAGNDFAATTFSSEGTKTVYRTQGTGTDYVDVRARVTPTKLNVDNYTVKKVLTPSATGVTISKTKFGTVMDWAAKDSAFNYNDSSGYTYMIYQNHDAVVVASGSISAGASRLDLTDTNAFAWLQGPELVTGDNSTFASDTGWWTKRAGGSVTIADGVCHLVDVIASAGAIYRDALISPNKWYKVTYTISNRTEGGIYVRAGGSGGGGIYSTTRSADGTYSDTIYSGTTDTILYFVASGETSLDLDNISFYELTDLTAYRDGNHLLALYNVTGGYGALGFISSSVPGGETLSGEKVTNGDMSSAVGWVFEDPATQSIAGGLMVWNLVANNNWAYQTGKWSTADNNKLFKTVYTVSSFVSGAVRYTGGLSESVNRTADGTYTAYQTFYRASISGNQAWVALRTYADNTKLNLDNFSQIQVTDPASTGALILSSKGGATRAWLSRHTSFDPNGAMSYKIYKIFDPLEVGFLDFESGLGSGFRILMESGDRLLKEEL